ncbi:cytochrome P450 [Cutaneotrichosporon oleaginosum]|uniref:Cytochrome P450 n=1 Tax=Cutaneotrichosporon oleaginosum TaxID=879819 RepID=A0A0J0XZE9_9TREE|nr:cytochrome P450 [Cutaneotrichosporon oleaginosum]KLT46413.1 cytochrome P450 [Cutaneotrichosporon oleaginosum]TXT15217.1 hypothetical protein COLE_01410 [Cutaneotrichosporon oleaginosum]
MEALKTFTAQLTPATVSAQSNILAGATALGVLAHLYWQRFEPDPISYGQFALALGGGLVYFFYHFLGSLPTAILYTAEVFTVFNTVVLLSMVIYRLSPWHPLAKYPGPAAAKVSKIYWWYQAKIGQTGYTQAKLHDQYGDFVRIGPNWISVRSADAIPIIYGGSKLGAGHGRAPWMKNDWYEGAIRGATRISVHQEVDVDKHHIRRKLWDHGFTGKALADYKPEILDFCDKLVRNVNMVVARGNATGKPQAIDMGLQSSYFSFDVMGVLGFGEPFGMLDAGVKHLFVDTLEKAMRTLIPFHEISWIRILLRKLLPLPERLKVFEKQNEERFERREKLGSARRDLFTYLLGEEKDGAETFKLTRLELIADAGTIVVAGSDTTSSLLTWFWYYSTKHPETYKTLRDELAGLNADQLIDTTLLSKLPYLNAALNETMRMQPAVPGGLRRLVPMGGVEIEGHYLPEGTVLSVPGYAIQHDPRFWGKDCNEYRPERWLDTSGKYNKNAYLPFSYGSRGCPGKGLAMVEARLAVAQLATRFEFAFPPGFSQREFEEGVRDHFTIQNMPLPLVPIPSPVAKAA